MPKRQGKEKIMKNLKQKTALTLALTLGLSMTACQKQETKDQNGDKPVLSWMLPGNKESDLKTVVDAANKILEEKIGATLDMQIVDAGAFDEKMKMIMASNTPFDLCFTGYVNTYINAVNNESLMPLTDLIKKEAPELLENTPDYFLKDATVRGEIYAVPNVQVGFRKSSNFIKKSIADKYNFDVNSLKTQNDLEPLLKQIKENETNLYPYRPSFGIDMWVQEGYEVILGQIAIKSDGSSKKAVILRDTEEYKRGVNTLYDWYKKGYIRSDVASAGDDSMDYNAGKYAISQSTWKPGAEASTSTKMGEDYVCASPLENYVYRGFSRQTMTAIGANSKNPEKAIKLISEVNKNKELYNILCFGIEGKHYNLNDDGRVVLVKDSGYNPNSDWKFGNQFNALLLEKHDADVWEETERLNQEAQKSPILGFDYNVDNIESEVAQINAILGEYYSAINQGSQDPASYTETMAKRLKDAGEDKVLADIQKQLDEFFANSEK